MNSSFFIDLAYWNGRIIDINEIERNEMEQVYQACNKNEILCLHCKEPLILQVTIEERPRFLHSPTNSTCQEFITKYEKQAKNKNKKHINGFILPQNKAIHGGWHSNEKNLKKPYYYKKFPPFTPKRASNLTINDSFHQHLASIDFPLDENQWKSVTTIEGPLLLLAGAGSGKTRVITARTYYMLSEKQIPANKLLLVTFTAKAANEMRERMRNFPNLNSAILNRLLIGTFHRIFWRMLAHHERDKWQKDRLLHSDGKRLQLLKELGKEFDIDEKDFAFDQALTQIGWWKNHLLSSNEVVANDLFTIRTKHLYEAYENWKKQHDYFDFDDILIGCYELLLNNQRLLAKYQERFQYISIDEFQDINKVQYEIVKMLANKYQNICVVGDDDQSIYAFRGSDPQYILNFTNDYPKAKTIVLNTNYRSHHAIVSYAQEVIRKNRHRHVKNIQAIKTSSHVPVIFYPYDEEQEATMITNDIKKIIDSGVQPKQIVILYRINNNIRALFERFIQEHIPFTIAQDGPSFYERNAVKKILAFFKLSINPNDVIAMEEVASALFLKREMIQQLQYYRLSENISLVQALLKLPNLLDFQTKKLKKIVPFFQTIRSMKPKEAVTVIYEKMGLEQYLKKNGNEGNVIDRSSDDIHDLLVATQSFDTIDSFLAHTEKMIELQKKLLQNKNDINNGVQLMTIHRSKGLEFDYVYIVGAVEGNIPHEYALDSMRNGNEAPLEEERRLMYVAITRAKQVVKISVPTQYRMKRVVASRFLPQ